MNHNCIFNSILSTLRNLIYSDPFLNAHRFPGHFVRKGKLTVFHLVMYLLNSTKQAMHQNIDLILDLPEICFPDVTKQAVSKARQGINPSLFKALYDVSVDKFYQNTLNNKLWKGIYNVFAIDGSRLQLPNSKSNFDKFGEMFSKTNPARRWSTALMSTIYDVCNDYIAHGMILPYLSSERSAAIQHCKQLESLNILKNSILIFDRGYYSEDMFRYMSSHGYLCVMRLKDNSRLSKNCKVDSVSIFPGSEEEDINDMKIRVISIDLGNGTIEYLATNIFDDSLTLEDFKDLYFQRWPIELKYNELKNQLAIEEFNGATCISVEQEFFINLLFSNLAALVKADADIAIDKNANPENKYRYQANRAYIIGRIKKIFVPFLAGNRGSECIGRLFAKARVNKSQCQPGRSSARNKIKRDRTHFNNRKTAV